jgi:putative addiction module component (TIGR02574 family)
MSRSSEQLISSLMQLPVSDRAEVADAILASLQPEIDGDSLVTVRDAWSNEIRNRMDDIDSGRARAVPSEDAWKLIDGEADVRS